MIKNISKGHTLLVKGPARITILEGKIDVFGKIFLPEKKTSSDLPTNNGVLIITGSQSYPLLAIDKSKLEIYTSVEDNLILVEENSISLRWIEIKDSIVKELKEITGTPLKIMVLGISSGKTTFIK